MTAPLRQRVLRPTAALPLPGDDEAGVVHLAAYDGGEVVGSVNVRRDVPPFDTGRPAGQVWRLRGMAALPTGTGTGSLLLAEAVRHVRAAGGRVLWCSARLPARAFYERAGFVALGEPWDDAEVGPHVLMRLDL